MTYKQELDDLDAEILAELYLRHLTRTDKSRRFIDPARLLGFLRSAPLPERDIQDLPLSSYLRMFRSDHQVKLEDVATALKLPLNQLNELELNTSVPWDTPAAIAADIFCFYRVDIRTLETLTRNSCNMAIWSGRLNDRKEALQLMTKWLSAVRIDLEDRGANDLIA